VAAGEVSQLAHYRMEVEFVQIVAMKEEVQVPSMMTLHL